MKFIGYFLIVNSIENVKTAMQQQQQQQGDQGQREFMYQQQRMQAQEQIDDQDIEFYHDYFPIDIIDTNNFEQKLIDQYAKGQSFIQNTGGFGESSNNYLSLTNNTSNINIHNLPQTPTTPQPGSAPVFQSSHSQDQLIKHHMEFLEAQRNKQLSLSQSQKYFNQRSEEQIFPQSATRQHEIENELFGFNGQNNNNNNNSSSNSQMMKFIRNHSSLEASTNALGSAKNTRNMYSGMSANNIFNGNNNNEISYISDYQNNHMIQENNINDSLKIEDEIQPIPNDGDMKYEDQSYLDSYLLYKNSVSQLNCAEDINLEDNQNQGSMLYFNNNNGNYLNNNQSMNDYSKFNGVQNQKYYLNQTNFLQNIEDDETQEPRHPQTILPHFIHQNDDTASNLNFNDENVYLEEKYIQDMLYMKRPNSVNYQNENTPKQSSNISRTNKQEEKRRTFVESTKPNIQQNRNKERSVTHNTSYEQKMKNNTNKNQIGQLKKQNTYTQQHSYLKTEKENRMVNKENNMSCVQLNPQSQQNRDKSKDIDRMDQNAIKVGKFISKRYINKENKKITPSSQISHKTAAEATIKANEEFLNQKTKNYLEILKKHLRTDQINTTNKIQKQGTTNLYQTQNPLQQQVANKQTGKINSGNTTLNKNSSPTKRLSNIYKTTRTQAVPSAIAAYGTNDPSPNNLTTTTTATITPTLRQNHSFLVNNKKDESKDKFEQKQEIGKSIGISQQAQQQKMERMNPYNLNMKNLALTNSNKLNSNTIQNTLRTNRTNKDEAPVIKSSTNQQQQANANNLATVLLNATQAATVAPAPKKNNPISPNTAKQLQPYIPSTAHAQKAATSSSSGHQLFDDISINNFKFEQEIGKGSYATVKLAMDRSTQIRYALKIYPRFVLLDPHKMRNVKREIAILRKMQHPNIIKMPFALEDKSNQIIVGMEYVGKQSLHGYLKSKPDRRLDELEVKNLFRQIVDGINYCHKMSVVHRDIKLENILLDSNNNIKIIDFGFSIINGEDKKLKIFCGTPSYMAPEIVSKIEYVGQKADIWALGILLYVMLQGKFPFKGVNDNELFKKIKKGSFVFTHPVSQEAEKLISLLLSLRPSERPGLPLILEHSWFNSN